MLYATSEYQFYNHKGQDYVQICYLYVPSFKVGCFHVYNLNVSELGSM